MRSPAGRRAHAPEHAHAHQGTPCRPRPDPRPRLRPQERGPRAGPDHRRRLCAAHQPPRVPGRRPWPVQEARARRRLEGVPDGAADDRRPRPRSHRRRGLLGLSDRVPRVAGCAAAARRRHVAGRGSRSPLELRARAAGVGPALPRRRARQEDRHPADGGLPALARRAAGGREDRPAGGDGGAHRAADAGAGARRGRRRSPVHQRPDGDGDDRGRRGGDRRRRSAMRPADRGAVPLRHLRPRRAARQRAPRRGGPSRRRRDEAIAAVDADPAAARAAFAKVLRPEERKWVDRYPPSRYLASRDLPAGALSSEIALERRLGILAADAPAPAVVAWTPPMPR